MTFLSKKTPINARLVILDLDGTLIDSRADLAKAVNVVIQEHGRAPLHRDIVLSYVGQGVRNLLGRSLAAADVFDASLDQAQRTFDRAYSECLLEETRLYPGVRETLDRLAGVRCVVLSNKPLRYSEAILHGLGVAQYFSAVFGGDSFAEMKPSPVPLEGALERFGIDAPDALMVGDSTYDLDAAQAASVAVAAALYGYHDRDTLLARRPDYALESFSDLRRCLVSGSDYLK